MNLRNKFNHSVEYYADLISDAMESNPFRIAKTANLFRQIFGPSRWDIRP